LLVLLARRLLEAAPVLVALVSTDTDQRAIRDLMLPDEAQEKTKTEAEADALIENMLAIEKHRAGSRSAGGMAPGSGRPRSRISPAFVACEPASSAIWKLERLSPWSPRHGRCGVLLAASFHSRPAAKRRAGNREAGDAISPADLVAGSLSGGAGACLRAFRGAGLGCS
jgi:hypothetical protein